MMLNLNRWLFDITFAPTYDVGNKNIALPKCVS